MSAAVRIIRDGVVTYPGMAHFAGTGPHGRTCRQCAHWMGAKNLSEFATPLPAHCTKYRQVMNAKTSERVPANALACSHFKREVS